MGGCGCASYVQKGPSSRAGHPARRRSSRSEVRGSRCYVVNPDPIRRMHAHPSRRRIPILGTRSASSSPALSRTYPWRFSQPISGTRLSPFPAPHFPLAVASAAPHAPAMAHVPHRPPLPCGSPRPSPTDGAPHARPAEGRPPLAEAPHVPYITYTIVEGSSVACGASEHRAPASQQVSI
jgi:hypothetical protein